MKTIPFLKIPVLKNYLFALNINILNWFSIFPRPPPESCFRNQWEISLKFTRQIKHYNAQSVKSS